MKMTWIVVGVLVVIALGSLVFCISTPTREEMTESRINSLERGYLSLDDRVSRLESLPPAVIHTDKLTGWKMPCGFCRECDRCRALEHEHKIIALGEAEEIKPDFTLKVGVEAEAGTQIIWGHSEWVKCSVCGTIESNEFVEGEYPRICQDCLLSRLRIAVEESKTLLKEVRKFGYLREKPVAETIGIHIDTQARGIIEERNGRLYWVYDLGQKAEKENAR